MNLKSPPDLLQAWRESAPYWEKYKDTIRVMFDPITQALIEDAGVMEGQSVVDVAGGFGEPSLTIAERVGSTGQVTFTDAIAAMVAAAGRESHRRGIANVRFLQCSANALPLPNDFFDVVSCRFGVMLFSDPAQALREMLRVLKKGGCLALAVWHHSRLNPYSHIPTEVLSRHIEMPAADLDAPGAFRFAEPGKLAKLLRQSGADDVRERLVKFRLEASIALEGFWPLRSQTSDTLREKLARLTPEQLTQVEQEVKIGVSEFFPNNRMDFPGQVIVVTGKKQPQFGAARPLAATKGRTVSGFGFQKSRDRHRNR